MDIILENPQNAHNVIYIFLVVKKEGGLFFVLREKCRTSGACETLVKICSMVPSGVNCVIKRPNDVIDEHCCNSSPRTTNQWREDETN